MLEERRVRGQRDDVGIALGAEQVRGLAEGGNHLRVKDVDADWIRVVDIGVRVELEYRILPKEDLRLFKAWVVQKVVKDVKPLNEGGRLFEAAN